MKLENTFTIDAPIDAAWKALNTPETIAPCFPGATLTEYEGDTFSGTVKVKLGPISLTYKGKGVYKERDDAAHRVVIDASGRDSRGNGTADAVVTGTLVADGPDKTSVTMVTDMKITGRPAQFGRGVIADVADKIIGQFASCVASKLQDQPAATPAPESVAESNSAKLATGAEEEPSAAQESGAADGAAAAAVGTAGTGAEVAKGVRAATKESAASVSAPVSESAASPAAGNAAAAAGQAGPAAVTPSTNGTAAAPAAAGPALSSTPAGSATPARPAPHAPLKSDIDAIDLLDTAGAPLLKRLGPPVAGGVLLIGIILLVVRWLRSR